MKPTLISGMYPHPSGCSGAATAGDPEKIIKDKVNINIVFGGCLSRPDDQNLSSPQKARRVYKGGMNTHLVPEAETRTKLRAGLFVLVAIAVLTAGCSSTPLKKYEVAIRVPGPAKSAGRVRVRLVLRAVDALTEPNLSRTEEYNLREKKPLPAVLLDASASRMRTAGIEPLEEKEASHSSGRLLIILTRLESVLQKSTWLASAAIRGERYSKRGRLAGKWEVIGRGSHSDSRLSAGGAGLAMGKAIAQALDKLPWRSIAPGR
jgi:hypothetical protein